MTSSVAQALAFLVQNIFQLYIYIVLVRFMLQLAKADFYNPISQFVVKATGAPLKPLRTIIPGFAGMDIAALVLAWLLMIVKITLLGFILYGSLISPLHILLFSLAGVANSMASVYLVGIIVSAISSWVPAMYDHPAVRLVWQLVEPVLAPFRRLLPAMGGVDISPIFALLILQVVKILLRPFVIF